MLTAKLMNQLAWLEQHDTHLAGRHRRALPVVQIELQEAISRAELELLEHRGVLHQVETVEHVSSFVPGQYQQVPHQVHERHGVGDVVVGVHRVELGVLVVAEDRRGQVVERTEVGDLAVAGLQEMNLYSATSVIRRPTHTTKT